MTQKIPNTIVILAGGKGTRLGELTQSTPKPLIEISGKPFLAWMTKFLSLQGVNHFIFSTGYLKEQFENFDQNHLPAGCTLTIVEESEPLGTGGGMKNVANQVDLPEQFWAGNGDSLWNLKLMPEIVVNHQSIGADLSFLCAPRQRPDQAGVDIENGQITNWNHPQAPYINAGLYLFNRSVFKTLPESGSFEHNFMPSKISALTIGGVIDEDFMFLDFGTPEFLKEAPNYLKKQSQN